jgi:hypothetical protein
MAEDKNREIKITIPVPEEFFALFLPGGAQAHLRAARKEVLLALRAVIDDKIKALEKRGAGKAAPKRKIKID